MVKTVYSTKCPGVGGQIKRRYADFIVEEITRSRKICRVERFVGEKIFDGNKLEIPPNKDSKDFLYLEMEKINKDLNYCIMKITRFLQCSKKRVGYAGMKDKRAITCQRISLYQPDLERLSVFSSRGIELRNPEWDDERIEIGMLSGNRFTITIRDIALEEKEIKERIEKCFAEINKSGIANFFGEQRFGGIRQVTHLVGREFINGNPEKAVMLYLTATCPEEETEIKDARLSLLKTNDFGNASKMFPVKYRYERAIIHHLCRYPKDFVGAFSALPKALRYLFTHAYQSYLFNEIIKERLARGIGLKKVDGDILFDKIPTAALFGFESRMASGEAGDIEKTVLEREGISLNAFKVKQMPELSSKGSRRAIVLMPKKLKFLGTGEDEFFPGNNLARVSFELVKGSYATTVLREIMKA